jgi:hypothetical protein
MAKEELIEMQGVVGEVLPSSRCRVKLENGQEVSRDSITLCDLERRRLPVLAFQRRPAR